MTINVFSLQECSFDPHVKEKVQSLLNTPPLADDLEIPVIPESVWAIFHKHNMYLWIVEIDQHIKNARSGVLFDIHSPPLLLEQEVYMFLCATLRIIDGQEVMLLSVKQGHDADQVSLTTSFSLLDCETGEDMPATNEDGFPDSFFSFNQISDPKYNCNGKIFIAFVVYQMQD